MKQKEVLYAIIILLNMTINFSQASRLLPCLPPANIGFALMRRRAGVSAKPPQTVWASVAREFLRRPETPSTETNFGANPESRGQAGKRLHSWASLIIRLLNI